MSGNKKEQYFEEVKKVKKLGERESLIKVIKNSRAYDTTKKEFYSRASVSELCNIINESQ